MTTKRRKRAVLGQPFVLRMPRGLLPLIDEAAADRLITASEYIRRAVIDHLVADGIDIRRAKDEAAE
jgi:hypothetical protein